MYVSLPWKRPKELAALIASFDEQTYEDRELRITDDSLDDRVQPFVEALGRPSGVCRRRFMSCGPPSPILET